MSTEPQYISDFTDSAQFFLNDIGPFSCVNEAIENTCQKFSTLKDEFDTNSIFSIIFRIECSKLLRDKKP